MNIFENAIAIKKEKEAYYRTLASTSCNEGIRNIFSMLAGEETHHREILEGLAQKIPQNLADSAILCNAGEEFQKMMKREDLPEFDNKELQLYERALKYEEDAHAFYLEKARQSTDPCHKAILRKIANEEKAHKKVIETVIKYVSKPERWLENAEWYHLEEY